MTSEKSKDASDFPKERRKVFLVRPEMRLNKELVINFEMAKALTGISILRWSSLRRVSYIWNSSSVVAGAAGRAFFAFRRSLINTTAATLYEDACVRSTGYG
jgi:hypothetical protein